MIGVNITCRIGTSSSCYAANLGSRLVGTEASVCEENEGTDIVPFPRQRNTSDPQIEYMSSRAISFMTW